MDPLRTLDLNLLLALHHLLETASVQAAAARLDVGQPAMSASLARLRAVFDDPLLERVGRTMAPTERALELAGPVRELIEGTRLLLVPPTPFDPATDAWTARIAMSDETRAWLLPLLLARLRAEAPRVDLRVRALTQASTAAGRTGEIDLAVFPEPVRVAAAVAPDLGPFVVRPLYAATFELATSHAHPHGDEPWTLQAYAAADHALVVAWEGSDRGFADELLERHGLARRVVIVVPTFADVIELVRSDPHLVTLLPDVLARRSGLRHCPVPFADWSLRFCYAYHPRVGKDPRIRWLRGLLESTAQG
jgi:DNA-binding transcriptional LysR family regulator